MEKVNLHLLIATLDELPSRSSHFAEEEVNYAEQALENAGFHVLGAGSYGVAVEDPESHHKCYKISLSGDDPWRKWAELCKNERKEYPFWRHMPIVYAIYDFGDIRVAHMRKYVSRSKSPEKQPPPEMVAWLVRKCPYPMRLDLHSNNTMADPLTGFGVVIDPWAHEIEEEYSGSGDV